MVFALMTLELHNVMCYELLEYSRTLWYNYRYNYDLPCGLYIVLLYIYDLLLIDIKLSK